MITCAGCSKLGTELCMRCIGILRMRIRTLAWLWGELQIEVTRQSQHSGPSQGIGKSTEKPLYFNEKAALVAGAMQTKVIQWTVGCGRTTTTDRLFWLSDNVFSFIKYEGALAGCWHKTNEMLADGMKVIDKIPRVFLGACPACGGELFGNPEEEMQRCRTWWMCRRTSCAPTPTSGPGGCTSRPGRHSGCLGRCTASRSRKTASTSGSGGGR